MAVAADIIESYRRPANVMRRHLAAGPREDRALVFLMLACLLSFFAQWPRLMLKASIDDTIPFEAHLTGALFGWLFVAPLFFYGLAALSRMVARLAGGQGTWSRSRLALFWTLLVVSPLSLVRGLVTGLAGPGALDLTVGVIELGIFAVLWFANLREAERAPASDPPAAREA